MKSSHKEREIYPERVRFGFAPGVLEVERIRFPNGNVATELRARILDGAQYSVYAFGDSPLGIALAQHSAVELLIEMEDALRRASPLIPDLPGGNPCEILRIVCQDTIAHFEARH